MDHVADLNQMLDRVLDLVLRMLVKQHERSKPGGRFKCKGCDFNAKNEIDLEKHILDKHWNKHRHENKRNDKNKNTNEHTNKNKHVDFQNRSTLYHSLRKQHAESNVKYLHPSVFNNPW